MAGGELGSIPAYSLRMSMHGMNSPARQSSALVFVRQLSARQKLCLEQKLEAHEAYLKPLASPVVHLKLPIVHQLYWERAVQSVPQHLRRLPASEGRANIMNVLLH